METPVSLQAPAAPVAPSPFAATPFPAAAAPTVGFTAPMTEGALAKAPDLSPVGAVGSSAATEDLRKAVVAALAQAGHASASQILGTGTWMVEGAGLRIEVAGLGKKMLALTVNAQAEKIIRQEMQRLNGPSRFLLVPGEGGLRPASASNSIPLAGSVEEVALAHPLVQRAKEIFKAEVRSVVDLREK
jgi:DNA polymerase-3 subunit gamma/tau